MIIWLASYPKSGNTWVRLFLDFYLNNQDDINNLKINQFPRKKYMENLINNFTDIKEFAKNCNLAQTKINLDGKIKIFKTHNANWEAYGNSFTNKENTLGVIHIVRDPRNVITSLQNHYDIKNINEALEFIKNKTKIIGNGNNNNEMKTEIMHVISSWSNHYNSWKKFDKNYLLVRYEDLIDSPIREFAKIIKYLGDIAKVKFDEAKFNNAVQNSSFDKLKNQEKQNGFKEAIKGKNGHKKDFFFLGPNNDWRKILNSKVINNINNEFKNEMIDLKYLS